MRKVLIALVMMAGCATYFGDDDDQVRPDAMVVAPVDAATVECGFTLPFCYERDERCASGLIPIECPHPEDRSVCWCPSETNPGWCTPP